ncbi:MAG: hypothetical protein MUF16_23525 [Burkholderiaceae bacterium]|jgi:type I restriction enzyme S subunit|nr:hypothetical protein [Burkholderiaceae bacterium]
MLNISQDAMLRTVVPVPPFDRQMQFERRAWVVMDSVRCARDASASLESPWANVPRHAFSGQLTANRREPRMKELLAQMEQQEQQARLLNLPAPTMADA